MTDIVPAYRSRLTAKRVGGIGRSGIGFMWTADGLCGADEFFSCRPLPDSLLIANGEWPPDVPVMLGLVDELVQLFREAPASVTDAGEPQSRDGVWWAPVTERIGDNCRAVGEVKRDLFDFVAGYRRMYRKQSWRLPDLWPQFDSPGSSRQRLPSMQWRAVTREAGEIWLVLAPRGVSEHDDARSLAGGVRCRPVSATQSCV